MIIKDVKGMYEIKVDTRRCIAFTKCSGFWKKDDVDRFQKDHETKVIPAFKGKKWAKCVDLKEFRISQDAEAINNHNKYCEKQGLKTAALILDKAIVKMQMNNTSKGTGLDPKIFDNEIDASKWLSSIGH